MKKVRIQGQVIDVSNFQEENTGRRRSSGNIIKQNENNIYNIMEGSEGSQINHVKKNNNNSFQPLNIEKNESEDKKMSKKYLKNQKKKSTCNVSFFFYFFGARLVTFCQRMTKMSNKLTKSYGIFWMKKSEM